MSDDMRKWLAKLKAQGHGDGWVVGVDVAEAGGDKTAVIVSANSEESLNEALDDMREVMRQNRYSIGSIIHPGLTHDQWLATIVQVDEEMETAVNHRLRAIWARVWRDAAHTMSTLMMWVWLAIIILMATAIVTNTISRWQHGDECRELGYDSAASYVSGIYCVREVRVPIDELREETRDE